MPTKLDEAYYEVTLRETKAIEGAKRVEDALGKKIPEGGKVAEKEINLAFGKMGDAAEITTHSIEHAFGHLGKMFAAGGLFGLAVGEATHLLMEMGEELIFNSEAAAKFAENVAKGREAMVGLAGHMVKFNQERDLLASGSLYEEGSFQNSGVAPELAARLQKPIDRIGNDLREKFGIGVNDEGEAVSMDDREEKLKILADRQFSKIDADEHRGKNRRYEAELSSIENNEDAISEYRQKQGFGYKFAHGPRDAAEHILAERLVAERQGTLQQDLIDKQKAKQEAIDKFPRGAQKAHIMSLEGFANSIIGGAEDPNSIARAQLEELKTLNHHFEAPVNTPQVSAAGNPPAQKPAGGKAA